jgi:hypothetical protein
MSRGIRDQLLSEGIYVTLDSLERSDLIHVVGRLQDEGHAVSWEDTRVNNAVISTKAHHLLSCTECAKGRK